MSTTVAPATQIQAPAVTADPKQVATNDQNTQGSDPNPTIAPEFLQAINDSFDVIGQTYDLTDNKEVFDFVRATLVDHFTHVQPREVKVNVPGAKGGKGRGKKVGYNLYISSRFAENKKNPTGESTTDLMTKFSKEWATLSDVQKQPYLDQADAANAKLFPDKAGKQKQAPRPMSGYNLYLRKHSAEFKAQYPELKSAERMTKIGAAWKALTKAQQEQYKQEAIALFNTEHPELAAAAAAAPAAAAAVAPVTTVIKPKVAPAAVATPAPDAE